MQGVHKADDGQRSQDRAGRGRKKGKDSARKADAPSEGRADQKEQEREFLTNLFRELFQTEQSARKHPRVEAKRLGDVPPAYAMEAIATHADAALPELRAIVRERNMVAVEGAKKVGSMFSVLRNRVADLFLSHEKSYRGTVLGLHHGMDLVTLIQFTATSMGDADLAAWCARWMEARRLLIEAAIRELAWFAAHQDRATEPVKHSAVGRTVQIMVHGMQTLAAKLEPGATSDARVD
jgi:hypothetical protein